MTGISGQPTTSEPPTLLARFQTSLEKLVPRGQRVLVAVSGGADSVALACAWARVATNRSNELVLASFDHRLREESNQDVQFVQQLADQLGLPCHTGCASTNTSKERGRSVEESARRARYAFLAETASQTGCSRVATAHTADDQVETVLLAMLRGTGLCGLGGMKARRRLRKGVHLVRPLLAFRRAELVEFLAAIGQTHRQDPTNDDVRFTRNRVRHELLPLLRERFNPRINDAILRLARQAQEAWKRERRDAKQLLEQAYRQDADGMVYLDSALLGSADPHLACAALLRLFVQRNWPRKRIGTRELERIVQAARAESVKALDLPEGIRVQPVRGRRDWIAVGRIDPSSAQTD